MSDVANPDPPDARTIPAPADVGAPMTSSPSVLVVEGDAGLRGAIRDVLATRGCAVDAATTGTDALRCVLRRAYDVVIIGVSLPGIDGLELTRLLSRRVRSPRIMLLMESTDPGMIREGYAAGASQVLSKPLSPTALLRLVETLVVS